MQPRKTGEFRLAEKGGVGEIATIEVIEKSFKPAQEMREAVRRGEDLGPSDDELAFYDALAQNEGAGEVPGPTGGGDEVGAGTGRDVIWGVVGGRVMS